MPKIERLLINAKKADKDKTFLYQLTLKPYQFAVSSITRYF